MALYLYVKAKPQPYQKILSLVSTFFVFSGLSLISWVVYPIAAFELFYAPRFISLIKPVPEVVVSEALENRILGAGTQSAPVVEAGVDLPKQAPGFQKPPHKNSIAKLPPILCRYQN